MEDFQPFCTVIIPTTRDRFEYNERIKKIFWGQDYRPKQLLFDYGIGTVGEKRNRLCDLALGDVIAVCDSDDIFASNWLTKSVEALIKSEADIVGLNELLFFDTVAKAWYVYTYPKGVDNWVAGGSMVFWKKYWKDNRYKFTNVGEDNHFLKGVACQPKVFAHEYGDGFVAMIHPGNTSKKVLANPRYRRCSEQEEVVLFERWKDFVTSPHP